MVYNTISCTTAWRFNLPNMKTDGTGHSCDNKTGVKNSAGDAGRLSVIRPGTKPYVNTIPKLADIFGMTTDELMQIKTESAHTEEKAERGNIISLILRAVCIAMGIAVTVLSILGELDTNTAITMSGIGVACAGVSLLEKK